MDDEGLLRAVDAVTIPVPGLEEGLRFYRDRLGHRLLWRDDDRGLLGLALPGSTSELVLTTRHPLEPDWLVRSVPEAVDAVVAAGGEVLSAPEEVPVGRLAVVADPFGNRLVLIDLTKGPYPAAPDEDGPPAPG